MVIYFPQFLYKLKLGVQRPDQKYAAEYVLQIGMNL